jgi:hypothetical protein
MLELNSNDATEEAVTPFKTENTKPSFSLLMQLSLSSGSNSCYSLQFHGVRFYVNVFCTDATIQRIDNEVV